MPILAAASQVDISVSADSTLTIQNPGGAARVEYPVGTPIWFGGSASLKIDIPTGTCRLVTVTGSAFYEMTTDAKSVGYLNQEQVAGFNNGDIIDSNGAAFGLSEAAAVVAATATGTAYTGAHEFRGIKVRALVGGPQTATIYDNTSATGTPIDTVVFNALGTWFWDRPSDVLPGAGGRRIGTTGIHIVFSGGTSRTVDVMVGAA